MSKIYLPIHGSSFNRWHEALNEKSRNSDARMMSWCWMREKIVPNAHCTRSYLHNILFLDILSWHSERSEGKHSVQNETIKHQGEKKARGREWQETRNLFLILMTYNFLMIQLQRARDGCENRFFHSLDLIKQKSCFNKFFFRLNKNTPLALCNPQSAFTRCALFMISSARLLNKLRITTRL